ncbi:MAG TPA: type II secretion system protein GspM [Baekduia sp.]|nr:type II secretion system protein GspM [Baekduia sp.]
MTTRDRLVVLVVAVLAACAGGFFFLVKPQRDDAAELGAKLTQEQQRLTDAQSAATTAQQAKASYAADYATVARLGKAIPADDDVASLVYQLEATAKRHGVDFRSVKSSGPAAGAQAQAAAAPPAAQAAQAGADQKAPGGDAKADAAKPAGGGTVPATQAAAATAPAGSPVGTAGLPTLPFQFTFAGSFGNMRKFLAALDDLTVVKRGGLVVRGRLLTIDKVSLHEATDGFPKLEAAVDATAYLVPPTEGDTAGASPQGPAAAPSAPSSGSAVPAPTAAITGGLR